MPAPSAHHSDYCALASWSGGKDSCLAVWRTVKSGMPVRTLLTMFDEAGERSRSHGLSRELLSAQAAAMGMQWREGRASWQGYEEEFVAQLQSLADSGHTHVVFGDIDLPAHREWEQKVCARVGLASLLPLWNEPREALAAQLWDAGFRAVVVCTDDRFLGAEFCGREFDRQFVDSLPPSVDPCGENGEFHTFVYDGPLFTRPVFHRVEGFVSWRAPAQFGGASYRFAQLAATTDNRSDT